jgi:predicted TIM-barrel fold metal-dependent hydrolase
MKKGLSLSRRTALKGLGSVGALSLVSSGAMAADDRVSPFSGRLYHKDILDKVLKTPLIDTHEHLFDEEVRLSKAPGSRSEPDDWSLIFKHYLDSDMRTAGMPQAEHDRFFSSKVDPADKWKILEPYWPAVKNTGYGRAVRIAMERLYGVEELSAATVGKVQAGYEATRKPGFYRRILCEQAGIESCQVNYLGGEPFHKSTMPTLLMQDISIVGMFSGPNINGLAKPAGIEVKDLADWQRVIDWWFGQYGKIAVAVKSQNAYGRDIDYRKVDAGAAQELFKLRIENKPMNPQQQKDLEDHLFWCAVDAATRHNLPVKLHTGYYAGDNYMPLSRLLQNPGSACDLCRASPQTRFVFMHIAYPYYEDLIAVAKHYTNAHLDMCWAWIINPVGAKDFLKKYLVTAPANKILTFGGDYIPVEPVLGHAMIARRGIALALSELVEEGWLKLSDAMDLIDPIMHGNARTIFNLAEKQKALAAL